MLDQKQSLARQFRQVITKIMHYSMQNILQFARDQGLSMSQLGALRHIHHREHCNISNIGDEIGISNAAASQMMDRLVQMGLVSRVENKQDRRNKHLELTEKGLQVLQEGFPTHQAWLMELIERLEPDEEIVVYKALVILEKHFTRMEEEKS